MLNLSKLGMQHSPALTDNEDDHNTKQAVFLSSANKTMPQAVVKVDYHDGLVCLNVWQTQSVASYRLSLYLFRNGNTDKKTGGTKFNFNRSNVQS